MPLEADVYAIVNVGGAFVEVGGFTRNYRWTFAVDPGPAATPEPTSWLLIGSGLAILFRREPSQRRRVKVDV